VIRFVADAHIGGHRGFATPTDRPGINSRCALALDLLSQVGAQMAHADTTVILGDLVDTERTVWDEAAQEYAHSGHLDITFATNDEEAGIVYPRRLGDYAGVRPVVTIHHGRADLAVEAESFGRYTVRVVLLRKELAGSPIEPGDEQTAAAHKHGAEHGWPAQEKT